MLEITPASAAEIRFTLWKASVEPRQVKIVLLLFTSKQSEISGTISNPLGESDPAYYYSSITYACSDCFSSCILYNLLVSGLCYITLSSEYQRSANEKGYFYH